MQTFHIFYNNENGAKYHDVSRAVFFRWLENMKCEESYRKEHGHDKQAAWIMWSFKHVTFLMYEEVC